jgi:hypothetical protein
MTTPKLPHDQYAALSATYESTASISNELGALARNAPDEARGAVQQGMAALATANAWIGIALSTYEAKS